MSDQVPEHPTKTAYVDRYTPSLLQGVDRHPARAELGIVTDRLPFYGWDVWRGYELSWLNGKGRPEVATLRIDVPATTPRFFESKSVKLYLNSFAQTEFSSRAEVQKTLEKDLMLTARAPVIVEVAPLDVLESEGIAHLAGQSLDVEDPVISTYDVEPDLLQISGDVQVRETLFSHLLRSVCPITGQPDWGTVWIQYAGPQIDHANLLAYIVSYRTHAAFHEDTVERIFLDIMQRCSPTVLTVHARYLRRGGIEINPMRSTREELSPAMRTSRQ